MEGAINVVTSIFLVKKMGMGVSGIFLGTTISTLVSTITVPWIVYKYLFEKNMRYYFKKFIQYLFIGIVIVGVSYGLMGILQVDNTLLNVIIAIFVSLLTTIIGIWIFCGKSIEYKYWIDFFLQKDKRNK